jgi:hypothetical protein
MIPFFKHTPGKYFVTTDAAEAYRWGDKFNLK